MAVSANESTMDITEKLGMILSYVNIMLFIKAKSHMWNVDIFNQVDIDPFF